MSLNSLTNAVSGLDVSNGTAHASKPQADAPTAAPTPSPRNPRLNVALEGDWDEAVSTYSGPRISKRAQANPTHRLYEMLDWILRTTYDKELNPDGVINIGIAENSLQTKEYLDYFGKVMRDALLPNDLAYGNQAQGSTRYNTAVAKMWNENFAPLQEVKPDDVIGANGATGALDQLLHVLADEGEGVLIAGPHYNGFDANMTSRSRAKIVHVAIPEEESLSPKSLERFEQALEAASREGINVRVIILCNPQNPYGVAYPRETLLAYAQFAEKHDLHLISDEIYALSVFDCPDLPDATPFISMLSVDVEKETGKPFNRSRLHIAYSFSKDFGVNGFRLGAIISQHNKMVMRTLTHTGFLAKISSPADALISHLINDKEAFTRFTTNNRRLLGESRTFMADWFTKRGCKPVPSNAGHFMMIDARDALNVKTFEDEKPIQLQAIHDGVMGMGGSYHYHTPGFLRVTFSMDRPTLELALQRLEKSLGLKVVA